MLIRNANAFLNGRFVSGTDVRTENGRVAEIASGLMPRVGEEITEAAGDWLLPGFVDVHIHATSGYDAMRGEEDIRAMARALKKQGVSAFLPTTMSASPEDTAASLAAVRRIMDDPRQDEALVLGAHMEAPFLSPNAAGAQKKEYFIEPSMDYLKQVTGGKLSTVRMITMAPELPGSEAFIPAARQAGIIVSLGHTRATCEQVHQAGDWGANHITHTFNAQTPLQHRAPGVPGASLTDDRFYNEIICDGIHLHPDILRLVVRCKGLEKAVMITDSMEAAGLPDGTYALGGQPVIVRGAEARLEDGTLAGSVLTMPRALRNMLSFGLKPEVVVPMCTSTPAASVCEDRAGRLAVGAPSPLTLWSRDWSDMRVLL